MKKIIAILLTLALMTAVFAGCSNNTGDANEGSTPDTTATEKTEQTQIDKALALINTFATGDTSVADEILKDDYIQHNLDYGTGKDAFIEAVKGLTASGKKTTVENIRAFEDGEYVFLQNVYNFAEAGEQVAFDVFRFENGKIAEHWDNLSDLAEPNPSGHTQIDGVTEIKDLDKTEENKEVAENFISDVLEGNNPDKTTDYFDGDNYIQHNTAIADGVSGLNDALTALAEQNIFMVYNETHLIVGQGNYVLALSEGTYADEPTAFFDLWRIEGGKIAEHWDIMSTIPDESAWANENGKF